MRIEGGSNNEVQNQEINQANNEQNRINQAEHRRNGEELEANSTIDNEGERKQIEGKDEATESLADESAKLDPDDTIEEDQDDIQDSLDTDDFIELDDDDFVDETDKEEQDPLDLDDTIEDSEDLDDEDLIQGDIQDSLDADDFIELDDDFVDEADKEEQDPLDLDDTIEDSEDLDDEDLIQGDIQDSLDADDFIELDDDDNEEQEPSEAAEIAEESGETQETSEEPESSEAVEMPEAQKESEVSSESNETLNVEESNEISEDREESGTQEAVETSETSEEDEESGETSETSEVPESSEAVEMPETQKESEVSPESKETLNAEESNEISEDREESDTQEAVETSETSEEDEESGETPETSEDSESSESVEMLETQEESEVSPESNETSEDSGKSEISGEESPNEAAEIAEESGETPKTSEAPEKSEVSSEPNETLNTEESNEISEDREESGTQEAVETGETSWEDEEFKTLERKNEAPEENEAFDSSDENKEFNSLENLSWDQINEMLKTPEGTAKLKEMNADYRERYEADMRGMTLEEYRAYKDSYERNAKEQEPKESVESPELSKLEKDAKKILERSKTMDEYSSEKYAKFAKNRELMLVSDSNSGLIADLKDVRQKVATEKDVAWNSIAKMNYDGTKESNPSKYQELCNKYNSFEKLEKQLDCAIAKTDINNWNISQTAGVKYHNEAKLIDNSDINSTYNEAEKVLKRGVSDNTSIMEAYRLGEKLKYDALPSLDGDRREVVSSLTMAEGYRDRYLRDNHCTHEEAMSNLVYAGNERYIQSLKDKKADIEAKIIDVVEVSTALHDQIPMADSDCKFKVINNKDGTLTIERSWINGKKSEYLHEGTIRNSETSFYRNVFEKKDAITMGQNSNSVYAHQFSFQYRGLGYKRETTLGGEGVKLKNSVEGGLLNFDTSFGYKRGIQGKMPTLSVDANGSLAQLKDTTSFVVKDKEYAKFSAEVSALKASASVKTNSIGIVKMSTSSHILGGKASAQVSGVTVAKVGGSFGEEKISMSTLDVLKTPKESEQVDHEKTMIVAKASVSLGNETSIVSEEYSPLNEEWENSNIVEQIGKDASSFVDGLRSHHLDINTDTVESLVEDYQAIQEIKDKGFGVDVSEKPIVIGNSGLKEEKVIDRPTDFKAKVVEHSSLPERTDERYEAIQGLKTSLEPFVQSKWDNMSFKERAEAIDKLAVAVASNLELESKPNVKYYQSDDVDDYGGYSASENTIYINANNMENATETADTIAHESRHCWQHEYVEKSDSQQANEFKENFGNYISPDFDYDEYLAQPVEKDARNYAKNVCKSIKNENDFNYVKNINEDAKGLSHNYSDFNLKEGVVFDKPQDLDSKVALSAEMKEARREHRGHLRNGQIDDMAWEKLCKYADKMGIDDLNSYSERDTKLAEFKESIESNPIMMNIIEQKTNSLLKQSDDRLQENVSAGMSPEKYYDLVNTDKSDRTAEQYEDTIEGTSIEKEFYDDFFKDGGSVAVCYMPEEAFEKFVENYGNIGRDDGQFVIPKHISIELENKLQEFGSIEHQTDELKSKMEEALALPSGTFGSGIVRVEIPITKDNLHMPYGTEIGANYQWVPGGKTLGGAREGIVLQISRNRDPVLFAYIVSNTKRGD